MTIASHGRRLDALAPTERPHGLEDVAREIRRSQAATIALVEFAQALAGTVVTSRWWKNGNYDPSREPAVPAARREPVPPAARPLPPRPERLDPRQVVTFEEAMKQPWVGLEPIKPSVPPEEQLPQPPRPKGWIDPWGGDGFLLPSYAGDEPE